MVSNRLELSNRPSLPTPGLPSRRRSLPGKVPRSINDDNHTVGSSGNVSVNTLAAFLLDSASQSQANESSFRATNRTVITPTGLSLEELRQKQMEGQAVINALNQFILQAGNTYKGKKLSVLEASRLRDDAAKVGLSMEVVDALVEQTSNPNAVVDYCMTSEDTFARKIKEDPHLSRMLKQGRFHAGSDGLNLSDSIWRVFMHKIIQQFLKQQNMELGDVMDKSSLTSRLYAEAFRYDERDEDYENNGVASTASKISRDYTEERKHVMISEFEVKQARLKAEASASFQTRTPFYDLMNRDSFYTLPQSNIPPDSSDDDDLSMLQVGAERDDVPFEAPGTREIPPIESNPQRNPTIPRRPKLAQATEIGGEVSAVKRGLAMFEKAGVDKNDDVPQKPRRKSDFKTPASTVTRARAIFEAKENSSSGRNNQQPSLDGNENIRARRKGSFVYQVNRLEGQRSFNPGHTNILGLSVAEARGSNVEKLQSLFLNESDMPQKRKLSIENDEPVNTRWKSLAAYPLTTMEMVNEGSKRQDELANDRSIKERRQTLIRTMSQRSNSSASHILSLESPTSMESQDGGETPVPVEMVNEGSKRKDELANDRPMIERRQCPIRTMSHRSNSSASHVLSLESPTSMESQDEGETPGKIKNKLLKINQPRLVANNTGQSGATMSNTSFESSRDNNIIPKTGQKWNEDQKKVFDDEHDQSHLDSFSSSQSRSKVTNTSFASFRGKGKVPQIGRRLNKNQKKDIDERYVASVPMNSTLTSHASSQLNSSRNYGFDSATEASNDRTRIPPVNPARYMPRRHNNDPGTNSSIDTSNKETARVSSSTAFSKPDFVCIDACDEEVVKQVYSGLTQSSGSSEDDNGVLLSTSDEGWLGEPESVGPVVTANRRRSEEKCSTIRRRSRASKHGVTNSYDTKLTEQESNPSDGSSWAGFESNNVFNEIVWEKGSSDRSTDQVKWSKKSVDRIEKSRFDIRKNNFNNTKEEMQGPSFTQANDVRGRPQPQRRNQDGNCQSGSTKYNQMLESEKYSSFPSKQTSFVALIPPSPAVVTNVTTCTNQQLLASWCDSLPIQENSWVQFSPFQGATSTNSAHEWVDFENKFHNSTIPESQSSSSSSDGYGNKLIDINLSNQSSDDCRSSVGKSRQYFEKLLRNEIAPPLASSDSCFTSSDSDGIPNDSSNTKSRIRQINSGKVSEREQTSSRSRQWPTQKNPREQTLNRLNKERASWEALTTNLHAEELQSECFQEELRKEHYPSNNAQVPRVSESLVIENLESLPYSLAPAFSKPIRMSDLRRKVSETRRESFGLHDPNRPIELAQLPIAGNVLACNHSDHEIRAEQQDATRNQTKRIGLVSTNCISVEGTHQYEGSSRPNIPSMNRAFSSENWLSEDSVLNRPAYSINEECSKDSARYNTTSGVYNDSRTPIHDESSTIRCTDTKVVGRHAEGFSHQSSEEGDSKGFNSLSSLPIDSDNQQASSTDSESEVWNVFGPADAGQTVPKISRETTTNPKGHETMELRNDDMLALREFRRRRGSVDEATEIKPGIVEERKRRLKERQRQEDQFNFVQDSAVRGIRPLTSDNLAALNGVLDECHHDQSSFRNTTLAPPTPMGLNRPRTVNHLHEKEDSSPFKTAPHTTKSQKEKLMHAESSSDFIQSRLDDREIPLQYDGLEVQQSSSSLSRLLRVETSSTDNDDVGLNSPSEVDWPSTDPLEDHGRAYPSAIHSSDSTTEWADEAEIRAAAKQSGIPSPVVEIMLSQSRGRNNHVPVAQALTGAAKYDSDTGRPASMRHLNFHPRHPYSTGNSNGDLTKDNPDHGVFSPNNLAASPCGGTRGLHDYHQNQRQQQREPRRDPSPNAQRRLSIIAGLDGEIPEGASEQEIKLLNRFIEVASGNFGGNKLSAESESRVRSAAVKLGLTPKLVDQLLDRRRLGDKDNKLTNFNAPFTFEQDTPRQPAPRGEEYHNYHQVNSSQNHLGLPQHRQDPSSPYMHGEEASTYYTVDYTRATKHTKKTETTEDGCNVWESLTKNLAYLTKQMPSCGKADDASSISSAPSWDDNVGASSAPAGLSNGKKRRRKHRTSGERRRSTSRRGEGPPPKEPNHGDENRGNRGSSNLSPSSQHIRGLV